MEHCGHPFCVFDTDGHAQLCTDIHTKAPCRVVDCKCSIIGKVNFSNCGFCFQTGYIDELLIGVNINAVPRGYMSSSEDFCCKQQKQQQLDQLKLNVSVLIAIPSLHFIRDTHIKIL